MNVIRPITSKVDIVEVARKSPMKEVPQPEEPRMEEQSPVEELVIHADAPPMDGFIYVPSIGLYVAKEKELFGSTWNECQKTLHERGDRMPTLYEFTEFIKCLQATRSEDSREILNDLFVLKEPFRAEWLDNRFSVHGIDVRNYLHRFSPDGIVGNMHVVRGVLMNDNYQGISVSEWIEDNLEGLPKEDISQGSMQYMCPITDHVAWLGIDELHCWLSGQAHTEYSNPAFGVRAVRRPEAFTEAKQ